MEGNKTLKGDDLVFFINGRKVVVQDVNPEDILAYYLREESRLTGTKVSCGEGACGACTVMVSQVDAVTGKIRHEAVNACLVPLCSLHGKAVTTVEGIGTTDTGLHPVQERVARSHGIQCGYCTPGHVMSMYTLLRNNPKPVLDDIQTAVKGNLCRCTGYKGILEGYSTFAQECGLGDKCCKNKKNEGKVEILNEIYDRKALPPYDASQEPIFPPELQVDEDYTKADKKFVGETVTWFRPTSLSSLLGLMRAHPDAKLAAGGSQIILNSKYKKEQPGKLIWTLQVPEMSQFEVDTDGVTIGASMTLSQVETALRDVISKQPEEKVRSLKVMVEVLGRVGSRQIRNMATVAGNIYSGYHQSDLNPFLMAAQATAVIHSADGSSSEKRTFDADFFNRSPFLKATEVMTAIKINFTKQEEFIASYKQMQRRNFDSAILNASLRVVFEADMKTVKDFALCMCGLQSVSVPVQAVQVATAVKGKQWDDNMIKEAQSELEKEIDTLTTNKDNKMQYRHTLASSFFHKFFVLVQSKLDEKVPNLETTVSPPPKSSMEFDGVPVSQPEIDTIGRPTMHRNARHLATGEAQFVDDIPPYEGELFMAFVKSDKVHAKIVNIDPSEALKIPGVHSFLDHKDVPGANNVGVFPNDEELFASEKVVYYSQPVGAILAKDRKTAREAVGKVKVTYEDLTPILTVEDAIKANSYHPWGFPIEFQPKRKGNVDCAIQTAYKKIEGEVFVGDQEHFYLETHVAIAIPTGTDSQMQIYTSSQGPGPMQGQVAGVLGVPHHKVHVNVKRLGGAFGGKSNRAVLPAAAAAVAARKTHHPVRIAYERYEDLALTSRRHPTLVKYKMGVAKDGRIQGLEYTAYANSGHSMDEAFIVAWQMESSFSHTYKVPNYKVDIHLCKTNTTTRGPMRGAGKPEVWIAMESIMDHAAAEVGVSQENIRCCNLEGKDDMPQGENLRKCWDDLIKKCDYRKRVQDNEKFNSENRWKKRGLALVPTKFSMIFAWFKGGAVVNIYGDGSVLVFHGGIEMGQGLYTKIIQIASKALEVDPALIHIETSSTNAVPNTIPTEGSTGIDINGTAVKGACDILKERLAPYKKANPDGGWAAWVAQANAERVNLSATYNFKQPEAGDHYYTFGAGCTEVEVDVLTGEHKVLRADILMDFGSSLNPALDIGQIEGAFVMGCGWVTSEQIQYSKDGILMTKGAASYKIPTLGEIPSEFNVSLLSDTTNNLSVYGSKGVGEPALMTGCSVFFAIRDAISAARTDAGKTGYFRLDSPATPEAIRLACADDFIKAQK